MTKEFNPLVTCIVPVYNSEAYIVQGIESLLDQTYRNLDIVLVDDHSTDSSWDICKAYASKHANVVAIQTETNSGGPLTGRLLGIRHAKGDWITFMDGDDYVKKDYIAHLVEATEAGKYDIAVTGYSKLTIDGKEIDFEWDNYTQSKDQRLKNFYQHFIDGKFNTDPTDTVGQNLIRAKICNIAPLETLPANVYAEDTIMALHFLSQSTTGVNFVDHHDFIWREVAGSGSNGGFYRRADRDAFYEFCVGIFSQSDIREIVGTDIGKVSIIVPVYNVETYLSECINSVLSQTYKNIEVLLVDDASTDNSGHIAYEYAAQDDRIKVISKPLNEGLNMARATGFDASSGSYVMFVDSDDLIAVDCVDFALKTNITRKTDFVKFNVMTFKDSASLPRGLASVDEHPKQEIISGKRDLLKARLTNQTVGLSKVTVWGGLYKSEAVKHIDWKASNYRQYEDNFWTMQLLEHVGAGTYTSRVGYFYRYDDSYSGVLSKALSGNSLNGEPVGYLEFVEKYNLELQRFNKKYKLQLDHEILSFITWMWVDRLTKLIKNNMLEAEHNSDYLLTIANHLIEQRKVDKEKMSDKDQDLKTLHDKYEELRSHIKKIETEYKKEHEQNKKLRREIQSFLSVKRSTRLLMGNVKRKIKGVIK